MNTLLGHVGGITWLFFRAARYAVPLRLEKREFYRILEHFGVKSLPLVLLTALITGALMVLQTGAVVDLMGATSMVGWASGVAVLKEVGPVLIGVMFSGQVGSFNAAELGLMKITEQVEALSGLGVDPVRFLVFPRMLAMMLMLAVLTVYGDLFALLGGSLVSYGMFGLDPWVFLQQFTQAHPLDDLFEGVAKAVVFGLNISVVSCYFGLQVERDPWEVGVAVNRSVVTSAMGIFVIDYFFALALV
jgi:phospholipid/cholesterol/gamma-HCH transport system permease protein